MGVAVATGRGHGLLAKVCVLVELGHARGPAIARRSREAVRHRRIGVSDVSER